MGVSVCFKLEMLEMDLGDATRAPAGLASD